MIRKCVLLCMTLALALPLITRVDAVDSARPMTVFFPHGTNEVLVNPYMGLAAYGRNFEAVQPVTLAHVNMYWRELEPEKGVYDFEQLEQIANFEEWKSIGVRLIIRLVLDTPRSETHMDIPEWLYEEIDRDGTWYDIRYGRGFSPNYANPVLIANHERLIQAIAERYDNDPAIAFVQLGSVGHWGEWHTFDDRVFTIPFPKQAITDQYVHHYLEAFANKPLMMRRPHQIALDHRMGLFNDAFGDHKSTVEGFMNWVENGYTSWLTKEEMPAMPDFWIDAPSGGEFYPVDREDAYYNDEEIGRTLDMIRLTHMSWIGPYSPTAYPVKGPYQPNIDRIMTTLGYRFSVAGIRHEEWLYPGEPLNTLIQWRNDGVAPFYFDWPVELTVINSDNRIVHAQLLDTDIREWLPGTKYIASRLELPEGLAPGEYTLSVAILDPDMNLPGIRLAMEGRGNDGTYEISTFRIVE